MSFDEVVAALAAMEPEPRRRRWGSLTYCVIDAVWSIGARYDRVVVPLVGRVAARNGDPGPSVDATVPLPPDPLPLPALLECYPGPEALRADTNGQLTSPRGGIPKAEAVLRYAEMLIEHGIPDLAAAEALMDDQARWNRLDAALEAVPGDGQNGVRRGYLWMLCGSDRFSKPDRMVLRWLARHGCGAGVAEARELLGRAAAELTALLGRPVTPWMVDHAIWNAERSRPAPGPVTTIAFDVTGWPPMKNEAKSLFGAGNPHSGRVVSPALDLSHLGELDKVALFADDRQIQQVAYRAVHGGGPSYSVHIGIL